MTLHDLGVTETGLKKLEDMSKEELIAEIRRIKKAYEERINSHKWRFSNTRAS